jgi:excinuclease UvrABC nuclease subunit
MHEQEFANLVMVRATRMIEFNADQIPMHGKPIVYMAVSKDQVLYVGMSSNGIERVFGRGHHVLSRIRPQIHKIQVYETETEKDAISLESAMIREFRPIHNNRQYIKATHGKYGVSDVGKIISQEQDK